MAVKQHKRQGAHHRDCAAGERLRAQVCIQVRPRPYGDVRKSDADRVCAKSISIALITGEVVLQAEGSGEELC